MFYDYRSTTNKASSEADNIQMWFNTRTDLRHMWFHNLGVHIISKEPEKADFFNYTEDIASRGSSEIGIVC